MAKRLALSDCKICRGISKTKCCFCGQKLPRKMDMTHTERIELEGIIEELAWLRSLYNNMRDCNMASTGDFECDERIRKEIGDWGELARGTVLARDGQTYNVQFDGSGNIHKIQAGHRDCFIGQRVTVRFFGVSMCM